MTLATTATFAPSAQGIIRTALQRVGVLEGAREPDAGQLAMGMDFLNEGIKALQNEGVTVESTERDTDTLVAGTATYTAASDTLDIDDGAYVSDGNGTDATVIKISREQYMALSLKTTQGQPTMMYVELGTVSQTVTYHLYPVPDSNWTTITFPRVRILRDISTAADTTDFRSRSAKMLSYMLAVDFAGHYGFPAKMKLYGEMFETEKEKAINASGEHGPVRFVADYGLRY